MKISVNAVRMLGNNMKEIPVLYPYSKQEENIRKICYKMKNTYKNRGRVVKLGICKGLCRMSGAAARTGTEKKRK